jgi:hypothetical protein
MSQTTSTFRSLLQKTSETVDRPRALAVGHYKGEIKNYEFGVSKQKQTPFLRLFLVPHEEMEDVLEGANDGIDITKREIRADYYIVDKALFRLANMLDAVLGKASWVPFDERIPTLRGTRVIFQLTQRPNEDETEIYNDVRSIIASD